MKNHLRIALLCALAVLLVAPDTAHAKHNPINGSCGSSNGATLSSKPTTGLCSAGSTSKVNGSGPWTWSCAGSNGGSTASCSANLLRTTILQDAPPSITAAAGASFNITYNWQAVKTPANYVVLVHFVDSNGTILFQDDHQPPTPTTKWSGSVSYTRTVMVPSTTPAGTYGILIVLYYTASGQYVYVPLTAGSGVISAGSNQYQTGTLTVTAAAVVNGQCGPMNGMTTNVMPTSELCNAGMASAVSGTGPWSWSCAGSNGGTTAQCSASALGGGAFPNNPPPQAVRRRLHRNSPSSTTSPAPRRSLPAITALCSRGSIGTGANRTA
jgi:hypothetical protein